MHGDQAQRTEVGAAASAEPTVDGAFNDGRGRGMTEAQRKLIIASLFVIGLMLAFIMLEWGTQWEGEGYRIPILVFYEVPIPKYSNLTNEWGIYTDHGIAGVLLGVIAPLFLFAVGAFIALGSKRGS